MNDGLRVKRPLTASALILSAVLASHAAFGQAGDVDWAMYNRDVAGTRHNPAESTIGRDNVGRIVEKWRFPAKGSDQEIGVIHATPVVVGGYVYFGTASDPTFYKLAPDGKIRWSYRNPTRPKVPAFLGKNARFQSSPEGILGSALVTDDTVYFGDIGGWFYALDRATGAERWTLNARAKDFPGTHALNAFFASPILADGKLIVAGGTLEQVVVGLFYRGSTGRGFVAALDPKSGHILWKYDVGPKPERLDPPITIKDSWGSHTFHYGPATSSVWSTPSFDASSGTIFFGTDVNTAPARPTPDDPRLGTRESCGVIALDVRDGSERWVTQISPGDVWINAMRGYDPKEGRYKDQSIGDTPKVYTIEVDGRPTRVVGVGCKNGGFYVLDASNGRIVAQTPIYAGPPSYPLSPPPDRRMLALPGSSAGSRPAAPPTAGRSSPTASTASGWGRWRRGRRASSRRRAAAWSRSARTRRRSAGATSGRGSRRSAARAEAGVHRCRRPGRFGRRRRQRRRLLHDRRERQAYRPRRRHGAVLKEVDLGPVWSGPVRLARARLRRHGEHAVHADGVRGLFPEEKHRRPLLLRPARRGRGVSPGRGSRVMGLPTRPSRPAEGCVVAKIGIRSQ